MMKTNSDIKSGIMPSPSSTEPEVSVKECYHVIGWFSDEDDDIQFVYDSPKDRERSFNKFSFCPKCGLYLLSEDGK